MTTIIKLIFEIYREENSWSLRQIGLNLNHVVRVIPSPYTIQKIKGEPTSEAVKQLSDKTEFCKVIFVEGQHTNSVFVVGNVSEFCQEANKC
jgi:hypothetical protein